MLRKWSQLEGEKFMDVQLADLVLVIKAPVLAFQGANDEYGTGAQMDAVTQYCATTAKTVLLDDCGHSPHRDQPDKSLEVIAKFVAQL